MQRAAAEVQQLRVIKWDTKRSGAQVGLFIDGIRYFLTPAEAYGLADRLVDAAERAERRCD
ncbi:hypothetical protein [Corynebacterium hindlerae]|uniref:hypothetical protein n=1 Tax=Corynebacterium hindlerae TaxID=699041 RepID=UPI003AAD8D23